MRCARDLKTAKYGNCVQDREIGRDERFVGVGRVFAHNDREGKETLLWNGRAVDR
jgi:hypothetical protein